MTKRDYGLPVLFTTRNFNSKRANSGVMVKRISKKRLKVSTVINLLNHSEHAVVLTENEALRLALFLIRVWDSEGEEQ